MSGVLITLVVFLLQFFPFPPPPPSGFETQSAYVQENFDGSDGNNEFVSNDDFRSAVLNNPPGSSFYGYKGFASIWAAVQDGRIDNLTRNNWKALIDYTRSTNDDITRTLVCEAAKADGREFNGRRCRDFYLSLPKSLSFALVLGFLIIFICPKIEVSYLKFRAWIVFRLSLTKILTFTCPLK